MTSSAARHARAFLDSADPDAMALDLVEGALSSSARDRAGRGTLRELERWTVEQLEQLGVKPAKALESEEVLDVLAATLLVSRRAPVELLRRRGAQFHYGIAALLDSLEPDFVPELLKETRRRMADDAEYADEISDNRRAVERLRRRAEAVQRRVVEAAEKDLATETQRPVVLRAAQDDEGFEVAVAVFVIVCVAVAVWDFVRRNDPAKN
jgi:hypothetical protein